MEFDALRAALAARNLGAEAPEQPPGAALRQAAVLVPLFEKEGAANVLLTRRRADLKRHGGQVSFPGGSVEPGDRDSLAAALREAREEVGLEPASVEVLGRLSDCLVLATGFRLTPWVASVPYPYPYAPDPGEVEGILEVPLSALARPGVHRTERREAYGMSHEVHFFEHGGETIWGATARVLNELLSIWKEP